MKTFTLYIFFCLASQYVFSQSENFNLSYHILGLGSNMGRTFYPLVNICDTTLTYTIEQNTGIDTIKKYRISKRRTIVDTIWNTKTVDFYISLRKETIDSIFNLVKNIRDTLVFESNHCIMSGVVDIIKISYGFFKVEYHLMNTFDSTALAICNIINQYLPKENKIYIEPDFIKERKACDDYFDRWIQEDKKRKLKASKSHS